RLGDADAAGGAERHVRGDHRVIRAVNKRDRDVDNLEPERAVLEAVDDALLHRADVIARNDAALDLVLEGEARAARQRLDVEHDVAVLAVAAGLLLVAAALLDRLADRLAVADARRMLFDGDAETIGKPLGH